MAHNNLDTFVASIIGDTHLRIEDDLGGGYVRLKASEAERRQAIQDIRCVEDALIEALRNARDAHARNIFVASTLDSEHVRNLIIIDDGNGIPENMHSLIFEPRVTSKLDSYSMDKWGVHGRGMALFSIMQNALSAEVVYSQPNLGTSLRFVFDTTKLSEKTDQSTFPQFESDKSGTFFMRGPKNIVRTACEFAFEQRGTLNVYFGNVSEIAASLYALGKSQISDSIWCFCNDLESLDVTKRLSLALDPKEFVTLAAAMGLQLSERTARRILDRDIEPAKPLIDLLADQLVTKTGKPHAPKSKALSSGRVKLTEGDKASLANLVEAAFQEMGPRYYLDTDIEATVHTSATQLVITVPLKHQEDDLEA